MTHVKTYNKSLRRINHKATKSKTNTGTTALERSVEKTTGGLNIMSTYSCKSVSWCWRCEWHFWTVLRPAVAITIINGSRYSIRSYILSRHKSRKSRLSISIFRCQWHATIQNIAQRSIFLEKKLSKKRPPGCAKLENFGFGKQVVDCQPSQSKINKSSYDKQPESATRPEQLGLGQKQDVNNHMQSASLCTQPAQVTRKMMNNHLLRAFMFPSNQTKETNVTRSKWNYSVCNSSDFYMWQSNHQYLTLSPVHRSLLLQNSIFQIV